MGWFKSLSTVKIPPPPGWIEKIPVVGASTVERWQHFAAVSPEELSKMTAPYASKLVAWFVGQAGNFSLLVLHFLLSIAIAAVLYAKGETTANAIRDVRAPARRPGGG